MAIICNHYCMELSTCTMNTFFASHARNNHWHVPLSSVTESKLELLDTTRYIALEDVRLEPERFGYHM